jgi:hypothetical protein
MEQKRFRLCAGSVIRFREVSPQKSDHIDSENIADFGDLQACCSTTRRKFPKDTTSRR